ncbi:kinase-like domain-containing protein [Endogone sp. FLAS-F59071]|nr:kinase-like domain-containing protein [Endogone sp. FLAS-F59071]|eukprot:RUS14385.1 kinase-like domain-containing protein [Endogone sp. FLAS-F59071]
MTSSYTFDGECTNILDKDIKALFAKHLNEECLYIDGPLAGSYGDKYIVTLKNTNEYFLTVALPGSPPCKIENEAACLLWLRQNTTIPVPAMAFCNFDDDVELGRHYFVTQRVPGDELASCWEDLSATVKRDIVMQLVDYVSQLREHQSHQIAGFAFDKGSRCGRQDAIAQGPVFDPDYFLIKRALLVEKSCVKSKCDRQIFSNNGPFKTLASYYASRLRMYTHLFETCPTVQCLHDLLGTLKTLIQEDLEGISWDQRPCFLTHRDLWPGNVLVHDGKIAAIVDWELAGYFPPDFELKHFRIDGIVSHRGLEVLRRECKLWNDLFEYELESRGGYTEKSKRLQVDDRTAGHWRRLESIRFCLATLFSDLYDHREIETDNMECCINQFRKLFGQLILDE